MSTPFGGRHASYCLPDRLGLPGQVLAAPSGETDGYMQLVWAHPGRPIVDIAEAVERRQVRPQAVTRVPVAWSEEGAVPVDVTADPTAPATICASACALWTPALGVASMVMGPASAPFTFKDVGGVLRAGAPIPAVFHPALRAVGTTYAVNLDGAAVPCVVDIDSRGFISIAPVAGCAFQAEVETYSVAGCSMSWLL